MNLNDTVLQDGSMLLDKELGSQQFGDSKWTGFNGTDAITMIDFGKKININSLTIGFLSNSKVWIFPPSGLSVEVSNDNVNYNEVDAKVLTYSKKQLEDLFLNRESLIINREIRYIKVIVKNFGVIPNWHAASGHKGWLFIDEILIN